MRKTENIVIRVNPEIKKKLQTAADAENRTLSNYLITAGLEKIKEDKKMEKRESYGEITYRGKTYTITEDPYAFNDDEYRAEVEDEEGNKYVGHFPILDSWKALPEDADVGQEKACDWEGGWVTK